MKPIRWPALAAGLLLPQLARASEFDGSRLSAIWGLPFAGILLSIALCPLLTPRFWHHHFGKVAAAWALAFLLPFAVMFGAGEAGSALMHVALGEYIPFVILITALFTVSVLIVGVVAFVFDVVVGDSAAWWALGILSAVIITLWLVAPAMIRARVGSGGTGREVRS